MNAGDSFTYVPPNQLLIEEEYQDLLRFLITELAVETIEEQTVKPSLVSLVPMVTRQIRAS